VSKRKYRRFMKIESVCAFLRFWNVGWRWFWLEHRTHNQTIHGSVLRNMSVLTLEQYIYHDRLYLAENNTKEG